MRLGSSCAILAMRFSLHFVSKKSGQILKPKEIGIALFIVSRVICAMQIMSDTQPDTFINALLSINIRQSVDISWKLTVETTSWKKTNLEF